MAAEPAMQRVNTSSSASSLQSVPSNEVAEEPGDSPPAAAHPLLKNVPRAADVQRFIKLSKLRELAAPYPRCQDLPDEFCGVMRACDKLIAVSHGWRYQMHPDPYGVEVEPLRKLLDDVASRYADFDGDVELYVFLDFLAIPQRPFRLGQAERTADEDSIFREALLQLDDIFLYADHIIHLDVPSELPEFEGQVHTRRCLERDAWALREIGGRVQCTEPLPFDLLLAVGGEPVRSAAQAHRLLGAGPSVGATVTLEKHPNGLPNMVPCGDRGWIYLERFITMVVAAMVDQEDFQDVVHANKVEILEEIHAGAECLRQAARRDAARARPYGSEGSVASAPSVGTKGSRASQASASTVDSESKVLEQGALAKVFADFERRLKTKRFSAASIDKSLNPALRFAGPGEGGDCKPPPSTPPSDAETAAGIMHGLVRHLEGHWHAEQGCREGRARVARQLKDYVLVWASYTPGFIERVQDNMRMQFGIGWLVLLLVVPLFLVLFGLLLPYQRPDASWEDNWVHCFIGLPWISGVCYLGVPQWTQVALGQPLPLRCKLLWPIFTAMVTALNVPAISWWTGLYPVPFTPLTAAVSYVTCLPLLWCLMPGHLRIDPVMKERFVWSVFLQVLITTVFCLLYPFLNLWVQLNAASTVRNIIGAFVFLGGRVCFERVVDWVSFRLSPDALPPMFWIAELFYQVALVDFFRNSQAWCISFIGVDLLENGYYLYCFLLSQPSRRRASSKGMPAECSKAFFDGSAASVAAVLLVRQLADMLVPAQYVAILGVLYVSPRAVPFNKWVADLTPELFHRFLLFVAFDFCAQLLMFAVVYTLMRNRGLKPLHFLRGVITASGFTYYLCALSTTLMWYGAMQGVHGGCDFTLRFPWVHDGAIWISGDAWQMPAPPA